VREQLFLYREPIFAGLLLGLAWLHPGIYPVGFLGVILLYRFVIAQNSLWRLWVGGTIAWTIKSLVVISWFFAAYPLSWLPEISSLYAIIFITLCWLYVGIVLGLAGGVLAILTHWLRSRIFAPLLFSVLWVFSEYLGSIFFAIATHGPGTSLNFGFSFGYLGYLLVDHSLLSLLAKYGGVFGLSGLFVALSVGVYTYGLKQNKKSARLKVGGVACAFLLIGYVPLTLESEPVGITVATIQTDFSAREIRDDEYRQLRATEIDSAVRAALRTDAAYILLPEGAQLFAGADAATGEDVSRFRFLYQDPSVVLIDSTNAKLGDQIIMRANIYDGTTKAGWSVVKPQLVPNGEYLPYITRLFARLLLPTEQVTLLEEQITLAALPPGDEQYPDHLPAVLFCFSGSDPFAVRRLVSEQTVPFVAHPMSHAHFGETPFLDNQLDKMLRIQALWNNLPIISAGNLVTSTLYTSGGKQLISPVIESGARWHLRLYTI
jgi:apolipoprotein N-acyltransferase